MEAPEAPPVPLSGWTPTGPAHAPAGVYRDAPWPMLVADDGGVLLDANPSACRLLKRTAAEVCGATWTDCVDPRVAWMCARDFASPGPETVAWARPLAPGTAERWVQVDVWPDGDPSGLRTVRLVPRPAPEPDPSARRVATLWRPSALQLVADAAGAVSHQVADLLCTFALGGAGGADPARRQAARDAGSRAAGLSAWVSQLARCDRFAARRLDPRAAFAELVPLLHIVGGDRCRVELDLPPALPVVFAPPAGLEDPLLAIALAGARSDRVHRIVVNVRAQGDALRVLTLAPLDLVRAAHPTILSARAVVAPLGGTLDDVVVAPDEAALHLRLPLRPRAPVLVAYDDPRIGPVLASVLRAHGCPAAWHGGLAATVEAAAEAPVAPSLVLADEATADAAGIDDVRGARVIRLRTPDPGHPHPEPTLELVSALVRRLATLR